LIQYPISNEISLRDVNYLPLENVKYQPAAGVKYSADAECVIYSQPQTGVFCLMN
jgi:hypothetical protein